MALTTWYIEIGDVKYAWRAENDKYKDIAAACGIKKADDKTNNLVFGANIPKPVRVRLNFKPGIAGNLGTDPSSQIIFCDSTKLDSVLGKGLAGKKSNGRTIATATLPG